jgi:hypothetical protein
MTGQRVRVIGVDPGPVPGMVILDYWPNGAQIADVVQCTVGAAPTLFRAVLEDGNLPTLVQIETFVIGRGSMRSGHYGTVTRDLIVTLREAWASYDSMIRGRRGGHWLQRTASQVKPWATDTRLDAAGLLEATKGMRHARDAARHALFCAVHDAGVPDPLSRKATR